MKLQRYEKELLGLKDRVKLLEELIEKEKGNKNDGRPGKGENYYTINFSLSDWTIYAHESRWDGDEVDEFNWNFCHGSTDKNKVKWTIKHIELVNEIKKYTRPFQRNEANWQFCKNWEKDGLNGKVAIWWNDMIERPSEYGYFNAEEDAEKVIEQFSERYILEFLFHPVDGDYKAVMDWLAEQEG